MRVSDTREEMDGRMGVTGLTGIVFYWLVGNESKRNLGLVFSINLRGAANQKKVKSVGCATPAFYNLSSVRFW